MESMVIAPVLDDLRNITQYIAIKTNITERRNLEQQFVRSQRLESIGLLAGGLSHDLNNVLSPILMGIELSKMRSTDPKDIARFEMLMSSAERGAGIVKQMLTFARGMDGERAPLNPVSLLKEVTRFLQETTPPLINVVLDVPEKIGRVMANVTQLHQVLINLGVNARDAMRGEGELKLSVGETVVEHAIVTRSGLTLQPGEHVVFTVSDTGSGIPSEVLDRVFEPFFTTKPRGRGTGLGLSTSHGIVRGHGGAIDMATEMGKGTRFLVYFPVCEHDSSQAPFESPTGDFEGRGRVVLVVDDEEPVWTMMTMALEEQGFEADQALDGNVAIKLFEKQPDRYAVVVLDFLMPGLNGSHVATRIKELRPQTPIIMSSGVLADRTMVDENRETYERLADYEMKKPYSMSRLLSVVCSAVGMNSPD